MSVKYNPLGCLLPDAGDFFAAIGINVKKLDGVSGRMLAFPSCCW